VYIMVCRTRLGEGATFTARVRVLQLWI
jgi:hypothetical protein